MASFFIRQSADDGIIGASSEYKTLYYKRNENMNDRTKSSTSCLQTRENETFQFNSSLLVIFAHQPVGFTQYLFKTWGFRTSQPFFDESIDKRCS